MYVYCLYTCKCYYTKKGNNEILPTQVQNLIALLIWGRNVQKCTQLFINYNNLRQIKFPYLSFAPEYICKHLK